MDINSRPFSPISVTSSSLNGGSYSTGTGTSTLPTWERKFARTKQSAILPFSPVKPKPNNNYGTLTNSPTSHYAMSSLRHFGGVETNLETAECSYMSVHSTNMSPTEIKTRINTQLVYYRAKNGDILSYRRKMQNGKSNLGYKANKRNIVATDKSKQQQHNNSSNNNNNTSH